MIILAAISINAIVGTNMINTAVSGVDNYVEAGEVENQIMENVVDYLDSIVASISKEPQTFTAEEIAELIGKYVDYTPTSGTYSIVKGNATYTGTDENDTEFTTDTNLHWRIWNIENGTLTLIADDVQSTGGYNNAGQLYLYGAVGYNNGVYLLNDICKTLYSNSTLGATGRSLDIVDIEEILDWDVWAPTSYIINGTTCSCYDMNTALQYTDLSYRAYPDIWATEDFSNIDGTKIKASYTYDSITGELTYTGSGLKRNEQKDLYTTTYSVADEYIEVTAVYWNGTEDTSSKAWINSKYQGLIFVGTSYWLASRAVVPMSVVAHFSLNVASATSSIGNCDLFFGADKQFGGTICIRPVVEISLSSVTLDTETTSGDDSANALKLIAR